MKFSSKVTKITFQKNYVRIIICEKLFYLKAERKSFKYIWYNDGGKNCRLMNQLMCSDWKMPIQFEFAARDTLQRNHLPEKAFLLLPVVEG